MLKVLLAHDVRRVVVTGVLAAKRDQAVRLGAHTAVDARATNAVALVRDALGESADVVFDCVASGATLLQAVEMADKGGTVIVVGVPTGSTSLPMPLLQDHQIRIQGSATYLPGDYDESIHLLREGAVKAADFVTGIYSLHDVAEAFAQSGSGAQLKVLVEVAASGNAV